MHAAMIDCVTLGILYSPCNGPLGALMVGVGTDGACLIEMLLLIYLLTYLQYLGLLTKK